MKAALRQTVLACTLTTLTGCTLLNSRDMASTGDDAGDSSDGDTDATVGAPDAVVNDGNAGSMDISAPPLRTDASAPDTGPACSLPPGPYQLSCNVGQCTMDSTCSVLTCTCANGTGGTQTSTLSITGCAQVANNAGALVCSCAFPNGSYIDSCKNCTMDGACAKLTCSCADVSGAFRPPTTISASCSGDIANIDGVLTCNVPDSGCAQQAGDTACQDVLTTLCSRYASCCQTEDCHSWAFTTSSCLSHYSSLGFDCASAPYAGQFVCQATTTACQSDVTAIPCSGFTSTASWPASCNTLWSQFP